MNLLLTGDAKNFANSENSSNFYPLIYDLIDTYLAPDRLDRVLQELPQQFKQPQARKWGRIDWRSIDARQIVGIEVELFLAILKGSIDTEAPIKDYTHTSRQYLDAVHPQMAQYVGGEVDAMGNLKSTGLWEIEESRHTPVLTALYHKLSGDKIAPNAKQVRSYQPTDTPDRDLYRHGLHRISTEYGATCLYLWLMGHSTGTLQQVLGELVRDEVNHLIKFWGFGIWLYPYPKGYRFMYGCRQLLPRRSGNNMLKTYRQMMSVMRWHEWTPSQRWQLIVTFYLVMQRLLAWHHRQTSASLNLLFGSSPASINSID